jgi:siroheme synthase
LDWAAVTSTSTLVLYMPGADYAEVAQRLRDSGFPDDLPCAIVSKATSAQQQIRRTNVSFLPLEKKLPAPALLIVGRVAAHRVEDIAAACWRGKPEKQRPQPSGIS